MLSLLLLGVLTQASEAAHPVPRGSYSQTCRQITVRPNRLQAVCGTVDGNYRYASLPGWRSCSGEIVNRNGHLVCESYRYTPTQAYTYAPNKVYTHTPYLSGSYQMTCTDIMRTGPSLTATCQTRDGYWVQSRLPRASDCRGEIANIDGYLTCMR
jgi:hypothetical protein